MEIFKVAIIMFVTGFVEVVFGINAYTWILTSLNLLNLHTFTIHK